MTGGNATMDARDLKQAAAPSSLFSSIFSFGKPEKDDVTALPEHLREAYLNPCKILGVSRDGFSLGGGNGSGSVGPAQIRDAFRTLCIHHMGNFVGFPWTRHTFDVVLLAYRLLTGELTGPAQALADEIKVSPLLRGVSPQDMLHTLRPLNGAVSSKCRASAMLAVTCFQVHGGLGKAVEYELAVSYCMRQSRVRRTQAQFESLHESLSRELVLLPTLPESGGIDLVGLVGSSSMARGTALCRYLQHVHNLLAQRGVFSPRLMAFLEVDFARVHIEEEGRLVKEHLDGTNVLPNTCWQVIEEGWMVRWRKYIQSHGARRYLPPGPIDNLILLNPAEGEERRQKAELVPRAGLSLGVDYRVVNSNVWWYWMKIYGGGPSLGHKRRDIYSARAISHADAVRRAQAVIRGYLARQLYRRRFLFVLSTQHVGSKELLYEHAMRKQRDEAERHVISAQKHRRGRHITSAARFTQAAWRLKKGYAYQDEKLKLRKHFQAVFEQADTSIKEPRHGSPLVVTEVQDIVSIAGLEEYDVVFDKHEGLTIGLRRKGEPKGSGSTLGVMYGGSKKVPGAESAKLERGGGEVTEVFSVPPRSAGGQEKGDSNGDDGDGDGGGDGKGVTVGSVLLAVNRYPVTTMSHEQIMERIKQSSWPLTLRFRRALMDKDVLGLQAIAIMRGDARLTGDVILEHIKRRLAAGVPLWRFSSKGALRLAVRLEAMLSIDPTHLYYTTTDAHESSSNVVKKLGGGSGGGSSSSSSLRCVSLYDLRHVTAGKTGTATRHQKYVPDEAFFSVHIVFPDTGQIKALNFAVKEDSGGCREARDVLVWGLRSISEEIQNKMLYMDKDGALKSRRVAKQVLKSLKDY